MGNSKYINILTIIIVFCLFYFFFLPQIISIHKLNESNNVLSKKINDSENKISNLLTQLNEYINTSDILKKNKSDKISQLKNLEKINSLYEVGNYEERNDLYLTERRMDEMNALIKIYEENNIERLHIQNNLQNFFYKHNIKDYYKNTSNILLTSSIIKNKKLKF